MYEESSNNTVKYVVIFIMLCLVVAGLFLLPLSQSTAQSQQPKGSFASSLAGNTICTSGLGCSQNAAPAGTDQSGQPAQVPSLNPFSGLFGGSGSEDLAGDPIITVVNVPGQTAGYRIINGLKHSIPTTEIFYSYGLTLKQVQEVTVQELNRYPTARLFIVEGTEEEESPVIYYLTDGGMLRPILNDKVFYSYGDRKEDVIIINQKEFNYYPRNQFIFIERPKLNREIYQITGGVKKYLTPVAVKRMDLKEAEIAPVNQIEFDAYPNGEPVIF